MLPAQEEGITEKKPPVGRLAWFVATSIPEDVENPINVMTGTKIIKVSLSKRMTSEPVKIPADGILNVVREVENKKDPTKPAYQTLAQAQIPDGMKDVLVILVPSPREKGSPPLFKTKVQSLASFKGGDYLYMNLTNLAIAVQLGDDKMGVKPGEVVIHSAGKLDKPTNTPVSYYFSDPAKDEWKLISASTIVMQPTRREICIFSWDANFDRVDYHGITFPVTPQPEGG